MCPDCTPRISLIVITGGRLARLRAYILIVHIFVNSKLMSFHKILPSLVISFDRMYPSSNNKTLSARLLARVITGCHYT
jgi:hypothetical protein